MITWISKFAANEVATICTRQEIQVLGGMGYDREIPAERHYCDVHNTEIYERTSEVQKLVIVYSVFKEYNRWYFSNMCLYIDIIQ